LLYSVSAAGGEPRPLTTHDEKRGETSHSWPQFLPDGRHVLTLITTSRSADEARAPSESGNAGLFAIDLDAPAARRQVIADRARHWFVPWGPLLSVHDGVLSARRFDAKRLATAGEPVPLATSVAGFTVVPNTGWFGASDNGRLAWLSGGNAESRLE